MKTKIQLFVTSVVVLVSLSCTFLDKELYPFAPYTMYSYRDQLDKKIFFEFYCAGKLNKEEITEQMMTPLDGRRLELSVQRDYFARDIQKVRSKLSSLRNHIHTKKFQCDNVVLELKQFENSEMYLNSKGNIVASIASGEK